MAKLVFTDPELEREETFSLSPTGDPVTIGRHASATLRFNNDSVSRRHCLIWFDNGAFSISDQGSANGTKVNDEKIQSVQSLRDGDRIQCGQVSLTFYEGEPDTTKKAPKDKRPAAADAEDPGGRRKRPLASSQDAARRTMVPKSAPDAPAPSSKIDISAIRTPTGADIVPIRAPKVASAGRPRLPTAHRLEAAASQSGRDSGELGRLQGQLGELAQRLRQAERERDQLRDNVAGKGRGAEADLLRRLREVEAERDELRDALAREQAQTAEQANELKELDKKAVDYSMLLESVTERYRQAREELDRLRERLVEARDESTDRSDKIDDLRRDHQILTEELNALRASRGDDEGRLRELKIRLTERDRQIDQLHDQLAEAEYELNEARNEVRQLQSDFNRDGGELARVEKRSNLLREVIEDKENIIAQLRRELEEKDREIKQVRMGVGLADLEEERRKVLDDFYKKSREADALQDKLATAKRDAEELAASVASLEKKLEEQDEDLLKRAEALKAAEQGLKDARRELASTTRERDRLADELAELQARSEAVSAEEHTRTQAELTALKRQVEQLQEKLSQARAQASEAARTNDEAVALRASILARLEVVQDSFASLRPNVTLLNTYVADIRDALAPVLGLRTKDGLPEDVRTALDAADVDLAVESFGALVEVIEDDAERMKSGMVNLRAGVET